MKILKIQNDIQSKINKIHKNTIGCTNMYPVGRDRINKIGPNIVQKNYH